MTDIDPKIPVDIRRNHNDGHDGHDAHDQT
jgi:hypothetical protein